MQGAANHRALAAGWQPLVGRRLVRAGTVPVAGQVGVPDVIGLGWDDAIGVLRRVGLVAVGPDPDGPPPAALGWQRGVVVDQRPDPGPVLPVGSPVMVWVERGPGSADVRELRRPSPEPRAASGMVDEESNEAVG